MGAIKLTYQPDEITANLRIVHKKGCQDLCSQKTKTSDFLGLDCYPFGSIMPGRNFSSNSYRFGFNGQEKDDEVTGVTGSHLSYKFREHDTRIGRFWSVDPLFKDYPWNSTYAFAENRVIDGNDLEGLEWQDKTGKGLGPLSDEAAAEKGATLEPGFKSESQIKAEKQQESWQNLQSHWKENFPAPEYQDPGSIKAPELPADLQMAKQIGEGIYQGLASEGMGQVIGLGVKGIGLGVRALGNLEVPLYRTFGGAGTRPSLAIGKFYSPVNPRLYGSSYAKLAGLPEWNASTFMVKAKTPISNLNLGSFGWAKPMGANTGRFVPEIQVLNADAVRVASFRVTQYTNPTYSPVLPVKLPGQ